MLAAGVPLRVPVPSPLSVKLTPLGRLAPPRARLGVGVPVVVTVNDPAVPTVKAVAFALLIVGACLTVKVKAWAGDEPAALVAVKVKA